MGFVVGLRREGMCLCMADAIKTIYGYCHTLKKEYSIDVEYIEVKSFGSPTKYIRSLAVCDFASWVDNDCPIQNECPLLKKAPEEMF